MGSVGGFGPFEGGVWLEGKILEVKSKEKGRSLVLPCLLQTEVLLD